MTKVHLMLLWHMHQPEYRDPATGRYVLPWTRLHATKDYWGMVRTLAEFPAVHATFNIVPSLGTQLEQYASGQFDDPWFDLAFRPASDLNLIEKAEILGRAFQVNHENLMSRWPRFVELFELSRLAGGADRVDRFSLRDWRDLQLLSQLAWMDEQWLASDPLLQRLSNKGSGFSEQDKLQMRAKQLELLHDILPEYRRAASSGQVELSTTPYFHPILPLLCDSDAGRESDPNIARLLPPFRHPDDAREQLARARSYHRRVFGVEPAGVWPSEGSVSNAALELAAEMGFHWFGADEGVLGRTLRIEFGRDAQGMVAVPERLYAPLRVCRAGKQIAGFFRDHYLSDLIGFVYGRMSASAAAEDLHLRLRAIGERMPAGRIATVSLILDGENAWEYYPGNGREFLRQFYGRIASDSEIRALTASEALAAAGEISSIESIVPGSWINANFDVWIGSTEDLEAWRLLRDARDAYSQAAEAAARGEPEAPNRDQLAAAYDALLAAEGSDWCWWYGPEHSSANDAEFDAAYRTLLTEVYLRLDRVAPDELAEPIKQQPEQALVVAPQSFLHVRIDGRESSYFEWLGAGLYSAIRQSGSLHGRAHLLRELHYGFDQDNLYLRVDPFSDAGTAARDEGEFRVTARAVSGQKTACELRVHIPFSRGKLHRLQVTVNDACPLGAEQYVEVAYDKILEMRIARALFELSNADSLALSVSLWHGGLPVDVLPAEGSLTVRLSADFFSWSKT
jgi:alpha-amylase/alpha-mannosidase (GH57 family)